METRKCAKCGVEKSLNEFYFRKKQQKYEYNCKKCEIARIKKYYNYEKIKQSNKKVLTEEQIDIKKSKRRLYQKNKRENDLVFKLKMDIRNSIYYSFERKNYSKKYSCEKIIGLKINDFIAYLLNTFKENYGYEWNGVEKIHIDHIIPLATAHSEDEVIKLCYYTNLQLLKAKDNLTKHTKILN